MLALYQQLFSELHESGVQYCIWKNVQEIPDALAGQLDIDLYVSPASHALFCTTVRLHGFTRLISHKATPSVEHFYGYDAPSGKFCHIHCYFRIVTGESHIKQFVVPIEDYLADFPNAENEYGVHEMHPTLQYKLNLFRRSIKLSCLPGVLLFFRERQGYRQERLLLEQAQCESAATAISAEASGWLSEIRTSSSFTGEIIAGLRHRIQFRHWNRFPALATPVYRYGTIFLRLAGKLRRRKKRLPIGISIAVTSTNHPSEAVMILEQQLASWLGQHFHVVTLPDSEPLRLPNAVQLPCTVAHKNSGLSGAIVNFWCSWSRHRKNNAILRQTMAGSIVVRLSRTPAHKTSDTPPCRKSSESALTAFVVRASDALFDPNPAFDLLIHLTSNSAAGIDEKAISTNFSGTAQSNADTGNALPGAPMQVTVEEHQIDGEARWKREVWRALVGFQP